MNFEFPSRRFCSLPRLFERRSRFLKRKERSRRMTGSRAGRPADSTNGESVSNTVSNFSREPLRMDLSSILYALPGTDDKTWARHIRVKAVASVEQGRQIFRDHVFHLSEAAEADLPLPIAHKWSTGPVHESIFLDTAIIATLKSFLFFIQKNGTTFLHRCGLPYASSRGQNLQHEHVAKEHRRLSI